jgi:putative membrane protein
VTFHLHPDVLLVLGGVAALWLAFGRPFASRSKKVWFACGLGVLLIGAGWPIHDLAEQRMYTIHMVQHTMFTLVAPPMLLLGTPAETVRRFIRPSLVYAIVRRITRPVVAFVIFNAVLVISHWPAIVTHIAGSEFLHFTAHSALVLSALIMWMPIVSPVMELPRMSYPGQMLYLFAQSILPTVPASWLTFADHPLYKVYAHLPDAWGISAITDQRMAGLFMKLVGGAILWGILTVLFFKWYGTEKREGVDVLQWRDVDRAMNRAGR